MVAITAHHAAMLLRIGLSCSNPHKVMYGQMPMPRYNAQIVEPAGLFVLVLIHGCSPFLPLLSCLGLGNLVLGCQCGQGRAFKLCASSIVAWLSKAQLSRRQSCIMTHDAGHPQPPTALTALSLPPLP